MLKYIHLCFWFLDEKCVSWILKTTNLCKCCDMRTRQTPTHKTLHLVQNYFRIFLKYTFQTPNSNAENRISHNEPKVNVVYRCRPNRSRPLNAHHSLSHFLCILWLNHPIGPGRSNPHAPNRQYSSYLSLWNASEFGSVTPNMEWWKSSIRTRITFMHNQIWMANDTWWLHGCSTVSRSGTMLRSKGRKREGVIDCPDCIRLNIKSVPQPYLRDCKCITDWIC